MARSIQEHTRRLMKRRRDLMHQVRQIDIELEAMGAAEDAMAPRNGKFVPSDDRWELTDGPAW